MLVTGITFNVKAEQLYLPAIRLLIKHNRIDFGRSLLALLTDVPVEQCWRILVEATIMEHLSGRPEVAWRVYEFILDSMRRFGPAYFEIVKVECRFGNLDRAIAICERGLRLSPRYSPLWLEAVRLYERAYLSKVRDPLEYDMTVDDHRQRTGSFHIDTLLRHVSRAPAHLPPDIMWRVLLEVGRAFAHCGAPKLARSHFIRVLPLCPENQRWKVWLAGARMEIGLGQVHACAALQDLASRDAHGKAVSSILLDRSRALALQGDTSGAADLLNYTCRVCPASWAAWVDLIDLHRRAGAVDTAIDVALHAVDVSPSTGRVWARLVALTRVRGIEAQRDALQEALRVCPKSGEVWTEAGRMSLNPLSPDFSVSNARKRLSLAVELTGQYGDPLIELVRLELATYGPDTDLSGLVRQTIIADPSYGPLWNYCRLTPHDGPLQVIQHARAMITAELQRLQPVYDAAMARRRLVVAKLNGRGSDEAIPTVEDILTEQGFDLGAELGVSSPFMFTTGIARAEYLENNACNPQRALEISPEDRFRVLYTAGLG